MNRLLCCAVVGLLGFSLVGCTNAVALGAPPEPSESDWAAVKSLVEDFGTRLRMVPLLAPKDIVSRSMEENYGDLVSPALLQEWQEDPANAPGRHLSSPWPDRIEITDLEELSVGEYQVKGEIIEVTSVEKASGGAAAKRPVVLVVKMSGDRWLINEVTLGDYGETTSVVYRNTQYGFTFTLPKSWTGHSIVTEKWEGHTPGSQGAETDEVTQTGPLLRIRHPQWAAESQRQDIPIMIFTVIQWDSLQKGDFHIGAAPIGPTEIGRNAEYVFALPARYNYAFPPGFEEVEDILEGNPLQAGETIDPGNG